MVRFIVKTGNNKEDRTKVKRKLDTLRRRINLDNIIWANKQECWIHGGVYFPMCRSKHSMYWDSRKCMECWLEKEAWAEEKAELLAAREQAHGRLIAGPLSA